MFMGRDLEGSWGDGPPKKFEMDDGPCIRPPIFWEVLLHGSVRKYEKKEAEFFCEIDVNGIFFWNRRFRQEKSDIYVIIYTRQGKAKKGRWLKKQRSSEIFGVKMKKGHSKILSAKILCPSPQTRRQVSAYDDINLTSASNGWRVFIIDFPCLLSYR